MRRSKSLFSPGWRTGVYLKHLQRGCEVSILQKILFVSRFCLISSWSISFTLFSSFKCTLMLGFEISYGRITSVPPSLMESSANTIHWPDKDQSQWARTVISTKNQWPRMFHETSKNFQERAREPVRIEDQQITGIGHNRSHQSSPSMYNLPGCEKMDWNWQT